MLLLLRATLLKESRGLLDIISSNLIQLIFFEIYHYHGKCNEGMSTSQNDDTDGLREPHALDDVLAARRLEPQGTVHEGRAC